MLRQIASFLLISAISFLLPNVVSASEAKRVEISNPEVFSRQYSSAEERARTRAIWQERMQPKRASAPVPYYVVKNGLFRNRQQ